MSRRGSGTEKEWWQPTRERHRFQTLSFKFIRNTEDQRNANKTKTSVISVKLFIEHFLKASSHTIKKAHLLLTAFLNMLNDQRTRKAREALTEKTICRPNQKDIKADFPRILFNCWEKKNPLLPPPHQYIEKQPLKCPTASQQPQQETRLKKWP